MTIRWGIIDAVYIATPVYAYANRRYCARKQGIPVLVEPVGMNVQALKAIRRGCR